MTEQIQETRRVVVINADVVRDMLHKTFQAGLGAVKLAQEEMNDWLTATGNRYDKLTHNTTEYTDSLVRRGADAEHAGRERVNRLVEQGKARVDNVVERVEKSVGHYSDELLVRLNVPTSDHIATLTKKIDSLGRKIDNIRKEQEKLAA